MKITTATIITGTIADLCKTIRTSPFCQGNIRARKNDKRLFFPSKVVLVHATCFCEMNWKK
jgi:hypothetical protein